MKMPRKRPSRRILDQGHGQTLALLAFDVLVIIFMTANPAFAADSAERLRPAVGNTILSTHPDGRKARLWLRPDGAYSAEGRAGQRSGGVWVVKGERLCLRQRHPVAMPFSYCKAIPLIALGTPWRDKAVTGETVTNEVVRGGAPREGR